MKNKNREPRPLSEIIREVVPLFYVIQEKMKDVDKISWNGIILN